MTEVRTGLDVIRARRARAARRGIWRRSPVISAPALPTWKILPTAVAICRAVLAAPVNDLFHGQAEYDATLN